MSGGYTHVTLTQLAIEEACFRREGLLHDDAKHALGYWKKFCIVGAVAPDYPYLDVTDSDSCAWADVMHKGHAVVLLRNGAARIRDIADVNVRQKCIAWLFGLQRGHQPRKRFWRISSKPMGSPFRSSTMCSI